jgi:hypothetical protein
MGGPNLILLILFILTYPNLSHLSQWSKFPDGFRSGSSEINQLHACVYLPEQAANPALSGRAAPQNCSSKSSRTAMMFVLRTYQCVPVYTSMYLYVLVHVLSYTVIY